MIDFGVTERKAAELEQRMSRCKLYEEDIEEKFVRDGGPGGQKVRLFKGIRRIRVTLKHLNTKPDPFFLYIV